jgi:formylglycine-generating enzyme required for sulfatase activity
MRDSDPCPQTNILDQWNLGTLSCEVFETISDHLENCVECQRYIEQLEDKSLRFSQQVAGLTTADLELARRSIEADSTIIQALTMLLENLKSQHPPSFVPTLKVPCQLRQYDVETLLGHGGMGEIYAARHQSLKRAVALKVIRSSRQDDPVAQAHFLREIETAGQLDHPNLVRAYDAWEKDGFVFLAQELLDGDSLKEIAKAGQIQSAHEILHDTLAICDGVEQLHSCGILHRDIKPSNIMRLRNGTIKLIDYGLAISIQADSKELASQAGTVGYMAPEQAQGNQAVDQRSDIYSIGCVIQYLLRHLPTKSTDKQEAKLRSDLASLAQQMTQLNPVNRPAKIIEVRNRLQKLRKENPSLIKEYFGSHPKAIVVSLLGIALLASLAAYLHRDTEGPRSGHSPNQTEPNQKQPLSPFQLKMADIPAGQFVMGGIAGDADLRQNELPPRTIIFKEPFRMSIYEITVEQFREFVQDTGFKTEAERTGNGGWLANRSSSFGKLDPTFCWSNPGYALSDNLPVTMVSYADAIAFCTWLSQRDGKVYRLPTEAEWEYCCRAGTTDTYSFPAANLKQNAWYLNTAQPNMAPRPVGTKQQNAWGLHDMIGNVREWCLDWYSETAYHAKHSQLPLGPNSGEKRVFRGGCFMDLESFLRSSHRGYLNPNLAVSNQGFRVVEVLAPASLHPPTSR